MAQPHLIFDLKKANRSHLVAKQVLAHKSDGTTYMTTVYVDPSTGQTVSQAPAQFDFSEFDKLKADKTAALKYLKDNGITWKENPHEGVNWMRACMAAKQAAGVAPAAATPKKTSSTGKVTPAPSTTQKTQSSTKLDFMTLATKGYDKTDGKTKTKILKTVISRENFFGMAHNLVTWEEHPNEAINLMRASMAFSDWADSHSLSDLSQVTAGKTLDEDVQKAAEAAEPPATKAPKGEKKEKKAIDNTLPIPDKADERTKSLIQSINAIKTKDDLDTIKSVGIVAEDDSAMEYLKKTLLPKAEEQKIGKGRGGGNRGQYGYAANEAIFGALDKTLKTMSKRVLTNGVISGQNQTLEPVIFSSPRSLFSLPSVTDKVLPSEYTDYIMAGGAYSSTSLEIKPDKFIRDLQMAFGAYDYAPDENTSNVYAATFHMGHNDLDNKDNHSISDLEAMFDTKKDGFCRALSIIAEKQPELKNTTDTLTEQYAELMKAIGYQPKMLNALWEHTEASLDEGYKQTVQRVKIYEAIGNKIKDNLSPEEYKLFSKEYLEKKYQYWSKNIRVMENEPTIIQVPNPDYDRDDIDSEKYLEFSVDFSDIKIDGEPMFDVARNIRMNLVGFNSQMNITPLTDKELQIYQEEIDRKILTSENRKKVAGLFGNMFKIHITNDGKAPYSDKLHDVVRPQAGDYDDLDAVLSNLIRMGQIDDARRDAIRALERKHTKSNANGSGANLENVLDLIDTRSLNVVERGSSPTFTIYDTWTGGKKEYSADEILQKLDKQARDMPVISLEKSKKLKTEIVAYAKDRSDKINRKYLGGSKTDYATMTTTDIYETRFDLIGGLDSEISVWFNKSDGNEHNTPTSHPLCDLMVENLYDLAVHSPSIRGARVKTDEDVKKLLLRNLGLLAAQSGGDDANDDITLELRKQVLNSVKCSISTIPQAEFDDLQHRIKMDWDQRVHRSNSAKFYGAYRIKNLPGESKFHEEAARIGETPDEFYHGTSFGGTKGILGTTGAFSVKKEVQSAAGAVQAGNMLGSGVYLAKKSSKSAQYFSGYNYSRHGRGTLFICDAVMGKKALYDKDSWRWDDSFDTVEAAESSGSRGGLCNDEWAVRHPEWVLPKVLIDMENANRV